jgi:hypothetical protein
VFPEKIVFAGVATVNNISAVPVRKASAEFSDISHDDVPMALSTTKAAAIGLQMLPLKRKIGTVAVGTVLEKVIEDVPVKLFEN